VAVAPHGFVNMDTNGGVRIGKSNKKEVSFPEKEVREYGVKILVDEGSTTPKQSACHYDYQLKATRCVVNPNVPSFLHFYVILNLKRVPLSSGLVVFL
jgi:hypothetical protein